MDYFDPRRLRHLGVFVNSETQDNRIRIRNLIEEKCEIAKKLPPHKKLLFLMYFDHGHSMKEIAELCGITEQDVSRRLKTVIKNVNEIESLKKGEQDVG